MSAVINHQTNPLNKVGLTVSEMSKLLLPTLPPGVDPTMMKLAYGRQAVPKLVSWTSGITMRYLSSAKYPLYYRLMKQRAEISLRGKNLLCF